MTAPDFKIGRRVLTMDELVQMKEAQPQYEWEGKLPGDNRGTTNIVFYFSINGYLEGKPVRGALLAGECMMVQANTRKQAERLAKEGLADTLAIARDEYEDRLQVVVPDGPMQAGMAVEGSGKHGEKRPSEDPELLKSDPIMKKMLGHLIGKLPWKH